MRSNPGETLDFSVVGAAARNRPPKVILTQ